jgi:hypothetical protein
MSENDYGLLEYQISEAVKGFIQEAKFFDHRKLEELISSDSARNIRLSIYGMASSIFELVTFSRNNDDVRDLYNDIKILKNRFET